tara:strand:+ start:1492 stop:2154 length:663 start_codon:yes stop_codon:yes gene_type:complete
MKPRNRIIGLRNVKASELVANPKNWRKHPEHQRAALKGILDEVGMADACIATELHDGRLMLLDGHLRAEELGDEEVPVLVLDVEPEEADKLLLTLDPLATLAGNDAEKLDALLQKTESRNEALQELFAHTAAKAGLYESMTTEAPAEEVESKQAEAGDTEREYTGDKSHQIVLVFSNAEFEEFLGAVGEYAERFGLSNNREVVMHLLESNGYAVSRPDAG